MSSTRQGAPGTTRSCPHCKATILETSSVCPACRHHVRFEVGSAERERSGISALRVQGTLRHPPGADPSEYAVLVTIANEKGEEVARHLVGVGALQPDQPRTFTLSVEVYPPDGYGPLR